MATTPNRAFDLVVIGGGTAGLAAVSEALDLGVERIALIEKRSELGGECALNACVPTNTMMTAVKILKAYKEQGPQYGIQANSVHLNFQKLMAKVQEVVQEGDYPFMHDPRVTQLHGEASFISKLELKLNGEVIRGDKIIIATGAEPLIPNIPGLKESGYLTFEQATHLKSLPKSLIIIGGYRVGVEFAQLFQWLGCRVTFVQKATQLLPDEEPDISTVLENLLKHEGVRIHTSCDLESSQTLVEVDRNQKILHVLCNGHDISLDGEEILVITGMQARTASLNLQAAGVKTTPDGIMVNNELQTNADTIWAIGDVVGPYRFTHIADYHAVVAVRNAINNAHERVDYRALSWAVFTEPPIAHVGLTEAQAREQYKHVVVWNTPMNRGSRYRIESQTQGFLKIIVDGETDRLLGAHLIASHAEDTAHTLMQAIQDRLTVKQALKPIHIYPAKAQIIRKALESYPKEKQTQYLDKIHAPQPTTSR